MTKKIDHANFFFDTADVDYIERTWKKLSPYFDGKCVAGVTTNPNAFDKVGITTMKQAEKTTHKLCQLVSSIRGDNDGLVYVQPPNSGMTPEQMMKFADIATGWTDSKTSVGIKIPPFHKILKHAFLFENANLNVTGVADCATALMCATYAPHIKYISVIPGRMEEKGIDAKTQIKYLKQMASNNIEIIAGSMRTMEGLKWVILERTVPTIGTRIWDQVKPKDFAYFYENLWAAKPTIIKFAPPVTTDMTQLSIDFFEQMDKCGAPLYADFLDV